MASYYLCSILLSAPISVTPILPLPFARASAASRAREEPNRHNQSGAAIVTALGAASSPSLPCRLHALR